MISAQRLVIERLGHRGEGVARQGDKRVFVPYALAGETVTAELDGEQARLIDILEPSLDRIAPICPYYAQCGGCAVQTLRAEAYAQWKRGLVESALRNAGLTLDVAPLVDAHGAGRRRATFHARVENRTARVGFMAARSHEIVEIDACPLLAPELAGALPAARALADILAPCGKPLDIAVTATLAGMDIDLRGAGPLDARELGMLIEAARAHDLARLSNHGRLVTQRRAPEILIGAVRVAPPPCVFLQATAAGETAIAERVVEASRGAKRVTDLFCGVGAFALRLAEHARVAAFDSDPAAVQAMRAAARAAPALHPLEGAVRDLFRHPLSAVELNDFQAIIFDPPRAGATAQTRQIAASDVRVVVAVSCNAQSLARDAAILLSSGYKSRSVTPIDQFRYSPHVETVAVFERVGARGVSKRRLLG